MQSGIPTETAVRVYKRYLRLEPMHTEEYIAYLKSKVSTLLCCVVNEAGSVVRWCSLVHSRE